MVLNLNGSERPIATHGLTTPHLWRVHPGRDSKKKQKVITVPNKERFSLFIFTQNNRKG
tara:strand:- start:3442 stop:3618 length:177 start_codon:yes stop_codon:yes gene_type:complete